MVRNTVRTRNLISLCFAAAYLSVGALTPAVADERVVTGGANCTLADPASAPATSLTVTKTAANTFDDVPDGELPPGPVDGMRFTLDRVDVPYATRDDALAASQLTLAEAQQKGFSRQYSAVTGKRGEAHFHGVAPGLYRLSETVPEDGKFNYRKSGDILLLLPLVSGRNCSVQYDSVVVAKPELDLDTGGTLTPTPSTSTPSTSGTSTSQTTPTSSSDETPETSRTVATTPRTTNSAQRTRTAVTETPQTTTPRPRTGLAETGANVLATIGFGALLVVLGVVLIARRRGNE